MAMKAGRVGVNPADVDKQGHITGSEYQLPTASAATLGGVKIGTTVKMTGETLDVKNAVPNFTVAESGKVLGVDSEGNLDWIEQATGGGGVFEYGSDKMIALPGKRVGASGDDVAIIEGTSSEKIYYFDLGADVEEIDIAYLNVSSSKSQYRISVFDSVELGAVQKHSIAFGSISSNATFVQKITGENVGRYIVLDWQGGTLSPSDFKLFIIYKK